MDFNKPSGHYLDMELREKLQEKITPLVERTYTDAAFKREFIENPIRVLQRETGETFQLPDGFEFEVVDMSNPYKIYIPLPVDEETIELSDDLLDLVAGGKGKNRGACGLLNMALGCNKT
ncbi:MAG: NHLP leader peptide family RiPP precursor [Bacteroidota bacterium]